MENQPGCVGGVGQVKFTPNSRNVLPGKVVFTVDIRSPDQKKLDGMRASIEKEALKKSAPSSASAIQSRRLDISTRSPLTRRWLAVCARRPKTWATVTWTSFQAPATTPAG
jgi:acetylornithine deacetylase/succinyl-diaminopimelate desuccinylase-like protein